MRFFKNNIIFFFIFCMMSCGQSQKKIEIIRFTMLNKFDSVKTINGFSIYKKDYFLVRNYRDDKISQGQIDSFVVKSKDLNLVKYTQYDMIFYKESDITNLTHLKENPRDLDRYSNDHDRIYEYTWWNYGKYFTRYKIKNGEIIDPPNAVIISDTPKDSTLNK